jgi:hypothetical protein
MKMFALELSGMLTVMLHYVQCLNQYNLSGSNRQKHLVIEQGVVPRLINLLVEHNFSLDTKVSSVL